MFHGLEDNLRLLVKTWPGKGLVPIVPSMGRGRAAAVC
jgi:hypothetical protein